MSRSGPTFERPLAAELARRLEEPRRFIQVVAGARQVGKTTLVRQVTERLGVTTRFASADEPTLRGPDWVAQQWEAARLGTDAGEVVLVLDEVQKAVGWAESVKRLWDEDTRQGRGVKVVLLGSAPLLVQQGLTESLAGRFEVLHLPHWSFSEMRRAFGFDLDEYVYYGGYPGAAQLVAEPERWRRYILDSLVETTVARDVLLLTRVDKPALLRRLFELGCVYSGQVLSYTKMLGQLADAGNTTTLAHYLELLAGAGLLRGLPKYAGSRQRQRASSPKLQVMNTALLSAQSGPSLEEARADRAAWGRWVESAVGAHLANASAAGAFQLFYWRQGDSEVDFVMSAGKKDDVVAVEVKGGSAGGRQSGLSAFRSAFGSVRPLLVGADGIGIEEFLLAPAESWFAS